MSDQVTWPRTARERLHDALSESDPSSQFFAREIVYQATQWMDYEDYHALAHQIPVGQEEGVATFVAAFDLGQWIEQVLNQNNVNIISELLQLRDNLRG